MSRQTEITLFGGPGHLKVVYWEPDCLRLEMHLPAPAPRPFLSLADEPFPLWKTINRQLTSYYRQVWQETAQTRAGAVVVREVDVGVWEGGELTQGDKYEMDRLLMDQEWMWLTEPSFLKDFDQWYEKLLHDIKWKIVPLRS